MKCTNYLMFSFIIFMFDRLTKFFALNACTEKVIFNQFMSCQIALNRGISWSLFSSESTIGFLFITSLVIGVIVLIGWYTYQQLQAHRPIWAEVAVIVAACSNVFDRFVYGGVVDFILLEYREYSWPLFNFADCVIVVGIISMLLMQLRSERIV